MTVIRTPNNAVAIIGMDGTLTYRDLTSITNPMSNEKPVRPEEKIDFDDNLTRMGEIATNIILKYIDNVAKVYQIDPRWIVQRISEKLKHRVTDL
jgi:hypothetical protein